MSETVPSVATVRLRGSGQRGPTADESGEARSRGRESQSAPAWLWHWPPHSTPPPGRPRSRTDSPRPAPPAHRFLSRRHRGARARADRAPAPQHAAVRYASAFCLWVWRAWRLGVAVGARPARASLSRVSHGGTRASERLRLERRAPPGSARGHVRHAQAVAEARTGPVGTQISRPATRALSLSYTHGPWRWLHTTNAGWQSQKPSTEWKPSPVTRTAPRCWHVLACPRPTCHPPPRRRRRARAASHRREESRRLAWHR